MAEENIVRITSRGKIRNYVSYAMFRLEEKTGEVHLRAEGKVISKCITVAEILKRRLPLHQITEIKAIHSIDSPTDLPTILITLSMEKKQGNHLSYQAPLPKEEISPKSESKEPKMMKQTGSNPFTAKKGRRGSSFIEKV